MDFKNCPKVKQEVVETDKSFLIDGKNIDCVLEDGVDVEELSKNCVRVTVSFLAKSYEFKRNSIPNLREETIQ